MTSSRANHFSPASSPHCHIRSNWANLNPTDLCISSFALEATPEAILKQLMTCRALSKLSQVPSRSISVSSTNIWLVIVMIPRRRKPLTPHLGCCSICSRTSTVRRKRYGASGQPCLIGYCRRKVLDCSSFAMIEAEAFLFSNIT